MPIQVPSPDASRNEQAINLGKRIRDAAEGEVLELPLATSQRIIARVTDGIYREPWAAFRELCANAYDADAKRVIIETGAPEFDQIVVRDDGLGMSPETLAYVVENIGGSSKRTSSGSLFHTTRASDPDLSEGGRPLIGKIGIGLFAVAQLTQHFQIITKARNERVRTWATVLLKTHNESSPSEASPKHNYEAGRVSISSEQVPESDLEAHGTTIILHDLRPEIRRMLQSLNLWQAQAELGPDGRPIAIAPKYHVGRASNPSRKIMALPANLPWHDDTSPIDRFKRLTKAASESDDGSKHARSLEHFDEYLRSIWKLSLSLPLKYIGAHPFDQPGDGDVILLDVPPDSQRAEYIDLASSQTLRSKIGLISGDADPVGGFDILFDGVLLRRPIELPSRLISKSRIGKPVLMVGKVEAPFPETAIERAGGRLRFEAYLYWNSTISPKDIQGSLIRVREASGTLYDQRFLNYQVSEQSRLRQISAEIFVLEGLDGAINIDRESFNYSHPHYIYIQKWLHRALRLLVNRLKLISSEHLASERQRAILTTQQATLGSANAIWAARRGEDSDPPQLALAAAELPATISDYSVKWTKELREEEVPLATALLIVLEAYNLLSELRSDDRASLVNDIIEVMRVHGTR